MIVMTHNVVYSFQHVGMGGVLYELRLLSPVPDGNDYGCDFVVMKDGIENERRRRFGISPDQAIEMAMHLLTVYRDSLLETGEP